MDIWTPLMQLDLAANLAAAQLCYSLEGPAGALIAALALGTGVCFLPRIMRIVVLALLCVVLSILLVISQAYAEEPVDSNLVTGLDVSSSMNAVETLIEIEGLAAAIQSPDIVSAIQRGHYKRIGFAVFLWADGEFPLLVAWRIIATSEDADNAAAEMTLRMAEILKGPNKTGTLTDLSTAMEFGGQLLKTAPYAARRSVLNIIGNGQDNVGEDALHARDALVASGISINGVVTGGDPNVLNYYRDSVIGGPMAFVLPADEPAALVDVFRRKFVTEIARAD
jgi:hypothetical protein